MGAWMIVGGSQSIAGRDDDPADLWRGLARHPVPTLGYTLVVGVLYALGGIVGLLPGENLTLHRVRWVWLFVNGVLVIPTVLIIAAAGNSTNVTVMLQVSLRWRRRLSWARWRASGASAPAWSTSPSRA